MQYLQNIHTHTSFCDGKDAPEDMVKEAIRLGLTTLGFSAHSASYYSNYPLPRNGTLDYVKEINRLKEVYRDQLEILLGFEYDMYCGIDTSPFDYVIGAMHYLYMNGTFIPFDRDVANLETQINEHFGGDGTYYYVDDIASKVRWVVLDTNDSTVEAEQISWLQNTALTFNESGWAVVFISHQPISNHYHALISNSAEVRTVVKNYINGSSANKADVVGWFSGHIHRDRIYTGIATNTTDDSQGTAMGFTQITITSDHTGIAYDDATKHTVANDDKSHAIDFVTINKATRKVNITRLGIGNDRSYTY